MVVAQPVRDGNRRLADTSRDNLLKGFALLNPAEFAGIVANRVIIEQASGVLMHVYDLDADNALELLKWGSKAHNIEIWLLAGQLTAIFTSHALGTFEQPTRSGRADERLACDDLLFTVR